MSDHLQNEYQIILFSACLCIISLRNIQYIIKHVFTSLQAFLTKI